MKLWTGFIFIVFGFFVVPAQIIFAAPISPGSFSTTWRTDNSGSSNSNQISFTLNTGNDGETCSGTLYWEELGNASNNGSSTLDRNCNLETITFSSDGAYRVDISGDFPTFRFSEDGDNKKIITVEQWGDNQWKTMQSSFFKASNLTVPASDAPDLSQATNLSEMFRGATSFNQSINHWNVSTITSINGMFYNASTFNQPLNNWNVSNVTNMSEMFLGATLFNQRIDNWNVSSVTSMFNIFVGSALSEAKYTLMLLSWSALPVQSDVYLGVDAQYCGATTQAARDLLTVNKTWVITDGGATTN